MRQAFYRTISKESLWTRQDQLLLAVSGGCDSMVLLHLCSFLHNKIAVAHCNFGLRNYDADADEQLVKEMCERLEIPCHTIRVNTIEYAQEKNLSIEMAARNLRYDFFQQLCKDNGYMKILTAHHANDNAETLLLNLIKGTGVRGLTGIPRQRDNIVRPLLSFTRKELENYAKQNNIEYRTDATNKESIYQRNKLRNEVLPLLETINPAVVQTLCENAHRFRDLRQLYEETIASRLEVLVQGTSIKIDELQKEKYIGTILYEWLYPLGFPAVVADEMAETLKHTEEKIFYAPSFRLIKSRGYLHLVKKNTTDNQVFFVNELGIKEPINLEIKKIGRTEQLLEEKHIAYLDAEKLVFPLELRHWKQGDHFKPLGLKGSKKISKFFKDLRYNTLQKEQAWLLCSEGRIVWVVGERIDDNYKVTERTSVITKITFVS